MNLSASEASICIRTHIYSNCYCFKALKHNFPQFIILSFSSPLFFIFQLLPLLLLCILIKCLQLVANCELAKVSDVILGKMHLIVCVCVCFDGNKCTRTKIRRLSRWCKWQELRRNRYRRSCFQPAPHRRYHVKRIWSFADQNASSFW